jgi:DNA mismatch endonuclease (patch repair protein)
MADVHDKAVRSRNMSRIRSSKNATTELAFINLLKKEKITGWRRQREVFGRPDFVFPVPRLAIFIDGCFWHSCPRCNQSPSSNVEYWKAKFLRNQNRDKQVSAQLRSMGWTVIRIWEHSLKKDRSRIVTGLKRLLAL